MNAGTALSVTYEFQLTGYTASDGTIAVYLPRLFALFPRAGGGEISMSIAPHVMEDANSSWSPAAPDTVSQTFSSSTTFPANQSAELTSELLAVMATTANYQEFGLSFRWSWNLTYSNGSVVSSPWSENTWTNHCPSNFWPAPYVNMIQDWNTTAPVNGTFSAALTGFTSSQYFFLELETPNGTVVYSHGQTAPAGNSTPYVVSLPYRCWWRTLWPGRFLVHIHNVEGALLYNLPVTITSGPSLAVNVLAQPNQGLPPLNVSFAASASAGSPPYSYRWSFGDGAAGSTGPSASHVYPKTGNFVATVTVTDARGATDGASATVIVLPGNLVASASASPTKGPAPLTVRLAGHASGGQPPYTYLWSFGDGSANATGSPVTHTFLRAGLDTVLLATTDASGAVTESTVSVDVLAGSGGFVAALSASSPGVTVGHVVAFKATTSIGDSGVTYRWSGLPPGCVGSDNASLTCVPEQIGSFDVHVAATDAGNQTARASLNLSVDPDPTVTIQILSNPNCAGAGPGWSLRAAIAGGTSPFQGAWTLGDGTTARGLWVNHTYASATRATVGVRITDASGAQAESSLTLPASCTAGSGGGSSSPPFVGSVWFPALIAGAVAVVVVVAAVAGYARIPPRGRTSPPDPPR
jgi:PKD repeat protein